MTNQKHYPDLGSDTASHQYGISAGKPMVTSPNVGCILRLQVKLGTCNIISFSVASRIFYQGVHSLVPGFRLILWVPRL